MGMSLGFHIIFAAIGIALPVLMAIAEGIYLRNGRSVFLGRIVDNRLATGFMAGLLILGGWSLSQYPKLITLDVTIFDAAAPPITLRLLIYALVAGTVLLLPSLVFLFRIFKGGEPPGAES